jgi:acetyl-CoA carboxylase biotin carboxyl carrier protein
MAHIDAHIAGTVWRVHVHAGDHVDAGQTVVVLESMKMEIPVEAEDEGTVRSVLVEEGQSVAEGEPLVEFE